MGACDQGVGGFGVFAMMIFVVLGVYVLLQIKHNFGLLCWFLIGEEGCVTIYLD